MRPPAQGPEVISRTPAGARNAKRREDAGQVLLLVIGFAIIVIALIAVVVDASRVFLYRRALAAAADGAVTAAVQSVDESVIYRDPTTLAAGVLPLDEAEARAAVEQYVTDQGLATRFRELRIRSVAVAPDAGAAGVMLSATVDLPLTRFLPIRLHSVTITVSATAHAPTE